MLLTSPDSIKFDGYILDRRLWTLRWRDEPIALSGKAFDLLVYLIDHRDEVVSKGQLLAAVWPKQVVEDSNLSQQIFQLRKALSRHESHITLIENIPGRGYRFVGKVDTDVEQSTVVERTEIHSVRSTTSVVIEEVTYSNRKVLTVGLVGLALALAAGVWFYWQEQRIQNPIAVVLADFGGAADPQLNRALNDALRIDLGQSPFFSVVPHGEMQATLRDMNKAEDTAVDLAVAREICERNFAQIVVHGSVTKFGERYLVSLMADSCVIASDASTDHSKGEALASTSESVERPDDLPHAIDVVAARLRNSLGESRASIRRFDKPLVAARTESLAALRAYSEALRLGNNGEYPECLALFQHAIELDPNFGAAYNNIVTAYYNLQDEEKARKAILAAYVHRDAMTEKQKLTALADYYEMITGDVGKAIETYKTQAALFPNDAVALINMAAEYSVIGKPELGLAAARRGVELTPVSSAFNTLAAIQIQLGQPKDGAATANLAISKGVDGGDIHHCLLHALYAQNNLRGVEEQLAWGRDHPEAIKLHFDEILLALTHGKRLEAVRLLHALRESSDSGAYVNELQASTDEVARWLAETGLAAESVALLKVPSPPTYDKNAKIALIEDGYADLVENDIQNPNLAHGSETIWINDTLPEIHAALLLGKHQPQEAIAALEPARTFDGVNYGPAFLRGKAYLELEMPAAAAREFEKITTRVYVDTLSTLYPLGILELARAQLRNGNLDEALRQYEKFLALWKDADEGIPLLQTAKLEYQRLLAGSPRSVGRAALLGDPESLRVGFRKEQEVSSRDGDGRAQCDRQYRILADAVSRHRSHLASKRATRSDLLSSLLFDVLDRGFDIFLQRLYLRAVRFTYGR